MAFDPDLATQQLVTLYRRGYERILERIQRKQMTASAAAYERAVLRDVGEILGDLDANSEEWARQVIPKTYNMSVSEVNATFERAGMRVPTLRSGFARVHRQAVEVIAENTIDNLQDATNFVGRRVRDQWRRVQLDVIADRVLTASTRRDAERAFMQRVADEGLGAFRDQRGRVIRMDAYAETVARSVTTEATNRGLVNQLRGMDRDLVQLSEHASPCEICSPLEGRVYSISGEDSRYPPLSQAFGQFSNLHPNCRHRALPYVEELADDPAADRERSNRPFDIDPRSQQERQQYEQRQTERRRQRQDRKQWESYRAWLPEDSPRTLSGFRRMKQADSERYRELQQNYREVRSQAREEGVDVVEEVS